MDNTNYLQEFNVSGCSLGFENFGRSTVPLQGSHVVCFCCLSTNIAVVDASKCNHTEFVKSYFKMQNASGLWICRICHYMLKKIELFRFQVYKSFHNLKQVPKEDSNWKIVNELTKDNLSNISITSIVKPEAEDIADPLEVTTTNEQKEIEIKIEPDYDFDISSEPTFVETIQTYTNTTYTETNDTKQKATSQNLNLMNMIRLTPIRPPQKPQKKENPLLKTLLTTEGQFSIPNYIKILPKPDTLTKTQAPNKVLQKDDAIDNKTQAPNKVIQKDDAIDNKTQAPNKVIQKDDAIDNKTQTPNKVIQKEVAIDNKRSLADTQQKPGEIYLVDAKEPKEIKEKEDDKVYSLLDETSCVIDSMYEGKIMELTMTQEQLEKERKEKMNKESFKTAEYKCYSCITTFNYEFVLDRHNIKRHVKTDAKLETVCEVCKCVYSMATYKNHFKKHFTRFVCVVCNEYSADLPRLALHFNQSHPEKEPIPLSYWCNECDFKTDSVLKYRQHRKAHRAQKRQHSGTDATIEKSTKRYQCEHCDRTYSVIATLRNHVKICHSGDTNTFYCEKCDKQFKTETIYRTHLSQSSAHAGEEAFKFICDYCGKKTKYKVWLATHIEREHLKSERFKCQSCNKVFGSAQSLKKHINFVHKKHKLPKNKICQYCGTGFTTVTQLTFHIRKHTGERPLKCDVCDMTFAHSGSLYTHRKLKHKLPRNRDIIAVKNEN